MNQHITATFTHESAFPFEQLEATGKTLAARAAVSDFCGAWLAFWEVIQDEYGEQIKEQLEEDEGLDTFFVKLARAYMAVVSAACKSDKYRSRVRRFPCGSSLLWSYASGKALPDGKKSSPESARVWANFARYWRRDGW